MSVSLEDTACCLQAMVCVCVDAAIQQHVLLQGGMDTLGAAALDAEDGVVLSNRS
jgi:hypothetical protein